MSMVERMGHEMGNALGCEMELWEVEGGDKSNEGDGEW